MSEQLRERAKAVVATSKQTLLVSDPDKYEKWIIDAAANDNADYACGALLVVASELLEHYRRTDPAYGLTPVGHVVEDHQREQP